MNKLAKGAIAGAAGLVLLLGGAGTFAYWNSEAVVSGGTITAGNLVVANDASAGVWKDKLGNTIDISTYRVAPGDELTFTDTLVVKAQGNSLSATLALDPTSIHVPTTGATAADTELVGFLTKTATVTASGPVITGAGPTYTVTPGTADLTENIEVKVVLGIPFGTVAGAENGAKLGRAVLDDLKVTLTQVP